MSGRKLLELAAKAAGLKINAKAQAERDAIMDPEEASLWLSDGTTAWNPVQHDSDEARLEAHLSLNVQWYPALVLVGPNGGEMHARHFKYHDGDRQAARRMAGVLAAAAIGEKMP